MPSFWTPARRVVFGRRPDSIDEGVEAGAYLGAEASGLAVDFTADSAVVRGHTSNYSGNVSRLLTVTRASSAWGFNAAGVLQQYGNNTPVFDHNPATLAALGISIFEQRTNLLLNSAALSTQSVTVTAVAHTLSFYGTGTVTLTGTSTAGPLAGTGANNRVSLTFTPTAGTLTLTVSGTVNYANLEIGSFPTSPIITGGATATRAADQISLATNLFPSVVTGTVVMEVSDPVTFPSMARVVGFELRGTSPTRVINCAQSNATGTTSGTRVVGTVFDTAMQAIFDIAAQAAGSYKLAMAWAANDFAVCKDGGTVLTDTAGTLPAAMSTVYFGSRSGTQSFQNGHNKKIKFLPRRASNAELQGFST